MSKIVSVQDISCFGQCSTSVALPILSAYGFETAILPSAILSTHTGGFKNYTVLDLTDEMPKILNHWKEEHISFDAIYTGYIGDVRQFDYIKDIKYSMLNDGGKLIVDPAMADFGRLYSALDARIVNGMRSIVKEADMILPNLTEAAFLLGIEYKEQYSEDEVVAIVQDLAAMGPEIVILTGVSFEEDTIGAAAYNRTTKEFITYFKPKIPKLFHGTGDVFASVAIASFLKGKNLASVLEAACEFVYASIQKTLPDEDHFYGVNFEQVLDTTR